MKVTISVENNGLDLEASHNDTEQTVSLIAMRDGHTVLAATLEIAEADTLGYVLQTMAEGLRHLPEIDDDTESDDADDDDDDDEDDAIKK
jgi:hypothetical protein